LRSSRLKAFVLEIRQKSMTVKYAKKSREERKKIRFAAH